MAQLGRPTIFAVALATLLPASHATSGRALPSPAIEGGPSIWRVLATRRSSRSFGTAPTDAELAQILCAQGTIDYHRTAPSAGALYPLTIRVADSRGVWRYTSEAHELSFEAPGDRRAGVAEAAFFQDSMRAAPVILVITADTAITAAKYGKPAAERFVAIEAGHAAQNALLAVTALQLAAVPIGAFDEAPLRRALALPAESTPLYLIAIGTRPTFPH